MVILNKIARLWGVDEHFGTLGSVGYFGSFFNKKFVLLALFLAVIFFTKIFENYKPKELS